MRKAWLLAALVAVGCEKTEEPKQEPMKPATETPKAETPKEAQKPKLTTADFQKKLDECNQAMMAKDYAKLGTCYADDAKAMVVDANMEMSGGRQIVDDFIKKRDEAFPDMKLTPQMVLVSGNQAAMVAHLSGTNSGPMMGMPATKKKVNFLGARYVVFADDGRIKEDWYFHDQVSVLHQLGVLKQKLPMPPRVDAKPPMDAPVTAVGTDSKAENDNVALVSKMNDAYGKGDVAGTLEACSDDFTFVSNTMPGELKGKEKAKKALESGNKAWTDRKMNTLSSFGAGDYVVSIVEMTGTNSGDMPMMKLKKTGKTVTTKSLMITQVTGGKAAKMWGFENSMGFYTQLGVLKPMMAPAPGAPGAEAAPMEKGAKAEGEKAAGAEGTAMEGGKKADKKKKKGAEEGAGGAKEEEPAAKPATP